MSNEKGLFFLTLSLTCVWVVLDNIWGKKYLDTFLSNVFDFYMKPVIIPKLGDSDMDEEQKQKIIDDIEEQIGNMDGNLEW